MLQLEFLLAPLRLALLFTVIASSSLAQDSAQEPVLAVTGADLFDGRSDRLHQDMTVLIRGTRIVGVGKRGEIEIPDGAEVVRLRGATLMPGLIDLHTHILVGAPGGGSEAWEVRPASWPAKFAGFLLAGVTSVRNLGDLPAIFELKRQERAGELLAPRLFVVGPIFTAPGGHPNPNTVTVRVAPDEIESLAARVTRPEDAKQRVRELAEQGIDAIKIVYTGGPHLGGLPKLAESCLVAIVEEGHALGLRVVSHTDLLADAKTAVRAGVDGLEHGVDFPGQVVDQELIDLMKERGTFYVPTLSVLEAMLRPHELSPFLTQPLIRRTVPAATLALLADHPRVSRMQESATMRRYVRNRFQASLQNLERIASGGVSVALGTDAGNLLTFFGPSVHRELELMVQAGMSPAQALRAATFDAARHLGQEQHLGTIEVGKLADLVAVQGNPLHEIATTRQVVWVVKNGRAIDLKALEQVVNPQGD